MQVQSEYPNRPLNNVAEPQNSATPFYTAPTDMVELPSRGLVYPKDSPLHSGRIEVKYMTAKEEDILSTPSFFKDKSVITRFLNSVIVTPGVVVDDLLSGDVEAILIAARVLGYGTDYTVQLTTPSGDKQTTIVDLSKLTQEVMEDEWVKEPGKNEFEFVLPAANLIVTFKLLLQKEKDYWSERVQDLEAGINTTMLKAQILSIQGDYNRNVVESFVDNALLAKDSRALKAEIQRVSPKVNLSLEVMDRKTNQPFQADIPLGVGFLWPDLKQ